jgi:hypothetical protein
VGGREVGLAAMAATVSTVAEMGVGVADGDVSEIAGAPMGVGEGVRVAVAVIIDVSISGTGVGVIGRGMGLDVLVDVTGKGVGLGVSIGVAVMKRPTFRGKVGAGNSSPEVRPRLQARPISSGRNVKISFVFIALCTYPHFSFYVL